MNKTIIIGSILGVFITLLSLIPVQKPVQAFHSKDELAYFKALIALPPPPDSNLLFPTSSLCSGCHGFDSLGNALVDYFGNDVNIHDDWQTSMMANSAKDPFWRAKVSHEVLKIPGAKEEIENKCTSCHAPMGHYTAFYRNEGPYTMEKLLQDTVGLDGVSCGACHMISPDNLAEEFSGVLHYDTTGVIFGPYTQPFYGPMAEFIGLEPVYSPHINDAGVCASCHTLITEPFDLEGNPLGTSFIEQALYHEWLNSTYGEDFDNITCQDCHMPTLEEPVIISANYKELEPRSPFALHELAGGNSHMLKLMKDNREALGINTTAEAFDESIAATLAMLQQKTLDMEIEVLREEYGDLLFNITLENKAGHKFPSGYPSRRAFVEVVILTAAGDTIFHSGKMDENFEVFGQDEPFEPHHQEITEPGQVQIYETIVADVNGDFTTVLEYAYSTLKDNRLTPKGFRKDHITYDTTQIIGAALDDPDFNVENGEEGSGKDVIHFRIPFGDYVGELYILSSVYYQSLPPKWMAPILSESTPEIDTFRQMFNNSDRSPVKISEAFTDGIFVFGPLNTSEVELGIKVYPNPVQNGWLRVENMGNINIKMVRIFSANGQLLRQLDWKGEAIYLDEPGIYFLEFVSDRGIGVKKVAVF